MQSEYIKNPGSRSTELRIVVLGKRGDGKSSAISTIMGEKPPKVSPSSTQCQTTTKTVHGKTIRAVKTPGMFDTRVTKPAFQQEMVKCIAHCAPGPHAFIIILKVGKYTAQEERILEEIQEMFGEDVLKYVVILFTNGDQLEEDQTINEFVAYSKKLQELVDKCGGRVHVIDNKYWKQQPEGYRSNRVQVEKLLNTIEEMVKKNRGGYYSNEMLQAKKENKGTLLGLFDGLRRMVMTQMQRRRWTAVVLAAVLVVGVYRLYY